MRKKQKAAAAAGGFTLVELVATPVGKRVFLLTVAAITCHAHRPITMSIPYGVDVDSGRCGCR